MYKYTYLAINILSVLGPIILSFDQKVAFHRKWKFLWPGLLMSSLLFLVWDLAFTWNGVWTFNEKYIIGIKLYGLPLEEMLFFITIPFACLFIYECINVYFPKDSFQKFASLISNIILGVCIAMLFFGHQYLYTLINFGCLLLLLFIIEYRAGIRFLGKFYRSYLVCLLPFYIVNGILTNLPVVQYNPHEIINLKILNIPFEDHFYLMSLLLINIYCYEYYAGKAAKIQ